MQLGMDGVTSGEDEMRDGGEGDTLDAEDNGVADIAAVEHAIAWAGSAPVARRRALRHKKEIQKGMSRLDRASKTQR